MSRSGYDDSGGDNLELYRQAVRVAIKGKRGQRMLNDLAAALDAMPEKRLVVGVFVQEDGPKREVCALGCLGLARGMKPDEINDLQPDEADTNYSGLSAGFDIAQSLAREVMYENDECGAWGGETPEQRWTRMRDWVNENLTTDPRRA